MNKRKISVIITFLALAFLAAFNMNIQSKKNGLSDVLLNNIEVLAQESNELECVLVKGFCVIDQVRIDHLALE